MTDLYAQQYESAGPIARPVIQRSQYLADALRALQNTSENPIRSRSQLGVNLLAQALMQYQQNRNQSQLQNATEKDSAALNAPLLAQLDLLTGGGGSQAPAASETPAAPPSPPGAVSPQALAAAMSSPEPQPATPSPPPAPATGPQGATFDVSQWRPPPTGGPNAQGVFYNTAPTSVPDQPFVPPPGTPGAPDMSTNGTPTPPPPPPPQSPGAPAGGAPPAATSPAAPPPPAAGGQAPGINGMAAIPQQELQYIRGLMGNPDPRVQAQGRTMLQAALGRAMQVPGYHTTADNDRGYIIYTPDNPAVGQPFTRPIPGWQPNTDMTTINGAPASYQHGNAAAGVTPVPVPQQLMSHPAQGPAEMAGITPGAGVDVDPLGNRRMVDRPPEGYNRTPGGLQAAPGGQHDITAPAQRVPALIAQRDRLRPTLEQANMVFQNINAVRRGVEAQSGPGDLAIANGFQQLLNSGMVTGEEINAQARSLGLQGQVGSIIQYVRGGGNLTPEARAQFGRLAEQLYVPRLRQIQQQVMSQRDLLDQYGPGSFDLVVPPSLRQELGWEPRPHQRPHAGGQPSQRASQPPPQQPRIRIVGVRP